MFEDAKDIDTTEEVSEETATENAGSETAE